MEPANPPLPTPMNFPFQFSVGSQSSILIRESEVGLRIIWTLQWAGILAGGALLPRAPARTGAGPSGTTSALVIVVSASWRLARFSHGVAPAAAPRSIRAMLAI